MFVAPYVILCTYERAVCFCIKFGCIWVTGADTYEVLQVTVGVLAVKEHKFLYGFTSYNGV